MTKLGMLFLCHQSNHLSVHSQRPCPLLLQLESPVCCLELLQPLSSQASWFPGQLGYRASNLSCSLSQFRDCIRLPRKGIDCGFPYLQITASCIRRVWTWRQASPPMTLLVLPQPDKAGDWVGGIPVFGALYPVCVVWTEII